jgi:hypothetical protein
MWGLSRLAEEVLASVGGGWLVKEINNLFLLSHPSLLAVFRQGDLGLNFYAVLGGQLEVRQEQPSKDSTQKVCW